VHEGGQPPLRRRKPRLIRGTRVCLRFLGPATSADCKPDGARGELHFLVEFFGVVDSSSVYKQGLPHVFGEVFWFEFLEFVPFCC
jgi:hypothetical protein